LGGIVTVDFEALKRRVDEAGGDFLVVRLGREDFVGAKELRRSEVDGEADLFGRRREVEGFGRISISEDEEGEGGGRADFVDFVRTSSFAFPFPLILAPFSAAAFAALSCSFSFFLCSANFSFRNLAVTSNISSSSSSSSP